MPEESSKSGDVADSQNRIPFQCCTTVCEHSCNLSGSKHKCLWLDYISTMTVGKTETGLLYRNQWNERYRVLINFVLLAILPAQGLRFPYPCVVCVSVSAPTPVSISSVQCALSACTCVCAYSLSSAIAVPNLPAVVYGQHGPTRKEKCQFSGLPMTAPQIFVAKHAEIFVNKTIPGHPECKWRIFAVLSYACSGIARVHSVYLMNVVPHQLAAKPRTKPVDWGHESTCRLPFATPSSVTIYYYSARTYIHRPT